jgi:hypothetical protein
VVVQLVQVDHHLLVVLLVLLLGRELPLVGLVGGADLVARLLLLLKLLKLLRDVHVHLLLVVVFLLQELLLVLLQQVRRLR